MDEPFDYCDDDPGEGLEDGYCDCGAVHTEDEITSGVCDCCGGIIDGE